MPKIDVNGVELYYELHGAEDAPLLVLNNGIIMNAAGSWVYQTKALSAHYRVLLYDCRGQGQSDHPDESYTMEMHADDLAALLAALGYEQAHIAGISYGGEVGQAFALKYPDRCASLILADTVSEVVRNYASSLTRGLIPLVRATRMLFSMPPSRGISPPNSSNRTSNCWRARKSATSYSIIPP